MIAPLPYAIRYRGSVALLLAVVGCVSAPEFRGTEERFTMRSDDVADDFEIGVFLPPGYESEADSLPLVVQLDGTVQGEPMAAIAESLDLSVVVVAVGYDDGFSPVRRRRDYTPTVDPNYEASGGFDAFSRFVRQDLLPRIESDYRVDPADRTISGHSLGGMAALSFALEQDVDDPVFHRVVAASPALWWDQGVMLGRQAEHAAAHARWPIAVFSSIGEIEAVPLYAYYQEMVARIEAHGYAELDLATTEHERTTHDTAWIPGYEEGLAHVHGR